jgi:hypothetical protein
MNESENKQQNDGPYRGINNSGDQTCPEANAEPWQQPARDQCANHANADVSNDPEA